VHVLYVIANNASVPYFNWFAERSLRAEGVRFSFVALYPERPLMLEEMAARGLDAFWVPFDSRRRKRDMLRALPHLYHLIRRIRPDVVHSHLFDDSVPTLLAARLARVPVRVITKQDIGFHIRYAPRVVPFDRFNNWNATAIRAVSKEGLQLVLEYERAPPAKVHLVYDGIPPEVATAVDPATVAAFRDRHRLEGRFVIGTVARLIEWKGHDLIIQAAARLAARGKRWRFLWAGVGDMKARLQQRIAEEGLEDSITFLDWVSRTDIPSLYRCLDVYLHPAVGEPFGFVVTEAMMNGVACAATPCGSTDRTRHLTDVYTLQPGSVDDIVRALEHLEGDPERRRSLAEAGRAHALAHSNLERMWEGHMELYRRAVAEARRTG